MVKLEKIEEIIKLALYSAYLKGEEQPISLLLQCEPETGKSVEVLKMRYIEGIICPTDMTAYGILKQYGNDILMKKIRHIIIPDLILPLGKRFDISENFQNFLQCLIEEGVMEVRTYAMSEKFKHPVKCGILGCITPGELKDRRHKWVRKGFMSRLLPVSWSYTEGTKSDIFAFIRKREYQNDKEWSFDMPKEDIEINLPEKYAKAVQEYTYQYAEATKTYGFRYQKHLQRLLMASALAEGREGVNKEDLEKVKELINFLNLKQCAI